MKEKAKKGAPPLYDEVTTTISFRVPVSEIKTVQSIVKGYLLTKRIKKSY